MTRIPVNPFFANIRRTRAGNSERLSSGALYLDRNERVEPFPEAFRTTMAERLRDVALNQYPELDAVYQRLASWLGVAVEQVFITEGVSGAVKATLETVSRPGGNVVFPDPGFALYPVYAEMYGQQPRRVPYEDDHSLDLTQLRHDIDDATSVVFLPNPNVPVGAYVPPQDVADLAAFCAEKGTVLVVDEVYFPFAGEGTIPLLEAFDNLMIARSFSKAFGAAGLRFGYLIGAAPLIAEVSKSRSGYEINALTSEVALHFLDNEHVVRDHISTVRDGMNLAAEMLRQRGLKVNTDGSGNFFFVDLGDPALAERVVDDLKARGIHVRGGWAAPWDRGFSVAGAGPDIMRRFADAFVDVYTEVRK